MFKIRFNQGYAKWRKTINLRGKIPVAHVRLVLTSTQWVLSNRVKADERRSWQVLSAHSHIQR